MHHGFNGALFALILMVLIVLIMTVYALLNKPR